MIESVTRGGYVERRPVEAAEPAARGERTKRDERREAERQRERKDTVRISAEGRALLEAENREKQDPESNADPPGPLG